MFDTAHWLLDLHIQRAYVTLIVIEMDAIYSTQPTALDKTERMTHLYSGLFTLNWAVRPFGRSAVRLFPRTVISQHDVT